MTTKEALKKLEEKIKDFKPFTKEDNELIKIRKEIEKKFGKKTIKAKGGIIKKYSLGGAVNSRAIARKYFKGGLVQVELIKFIKHVSTKVEKEITDRKDAFAMGKIEDNNYKKVVGELRGLQIARDLIRESSKHIEEDDEQHNL